MANGAQPAAGGQWAAAAPPEFRARVIQKIMKICPQVLQGRRVSDLHRHAAASQYEAKVFSESGNWEDYLTKISGKLMGVQQKRQPAVQAAPDHQLQAHIAVPANSPAPALPRTASTVPLPQRPPQVQNMQFNVQQSHPSNFPPAAPVVQLHARRPAVTQTQNQCRAEHNGIYTQQLRHQQQDLRVTQRQSYHAYGGQPSNAARMQIGHPDGQNNQQSAAEVDWREDIFQKITSLKDAHLSELLECERAMRAHIPQSTTNEQLNSLPEKQADKYRKGACIMARIRWVLSILQLEKSNIPELAKDQFDKWQSSLYSLLKFYRANKARNPSKNVGLQSQNCHEVPQVADVADATDYRQQKHQEHTTAEAFPHPSQDVPSRAPLAQQQNHSDHLAAEAENVEVVRLEAEVPVAVNFTAVTGDTAPFSGGMCSQQVQEEHPADKAISELTQDVSVAPPAEYQTRSAHSVHVEPEVEAEAPVALEAPIKHGDVAARPLPLAERRSLASDMGVNMKRAFPHTTPDTMDGSSCAWSDESREESCRKRRKTHYTSLPDEIRAARSMLVETDISISEDDIGRADGTVIELCYNAVSLAPQLSAAFGASEIRTKLLVPANYPESSPVILGGDGEWRKGLPGVVDVAFQRALVLLPEPWSIEGMAMAWDSVTRRAVGVFAHRLGGGPFSTRYGIPV